MRFRGICAIRFVIARCVSETNATKQSILVNLESKANNLLLANLNAIIYRFIFGALCESTF